MIGKSERNGGFSPEILEGAEVRFARLESGLVKEERSSGEKFLFVTISSEPKGA